MFLACIDVFYNDKFLDFEDKELFIFGCWLGLNK